MATTDEAIENLCEVMAAKYGAGVDFRESLHGMVAKCREAHERRMRDAQAAELLPKHGADVVAIRQGCHRATAYRRARRAILSHRSQADATPA
jgi:hypothetical protein